MTEQSDLSNAERYAILNAARRVLDEIRTEHYEASVPARTQLAGAHGMAAALAEVAEEAIFDAMNTLTHHVGDAEAREALDRRLAHTDPDLSLFVSELRLMGGNRVHADREAEADAAFEDVRAGDMLGRRP